MTVFEAHCALGRTLPEDLHRRNPLVVWVARRGIASNGFIELVFAHRLSDGVGGELGERWVISGCFVASGRRPAVPLWHRTLLATRTPGFIPGPDCRLHADSSHSDSKVVWADNIVQRCLRHILIEPAL